jgi:hypothetical protein
MFEPLAVRLWRRDYQRLADACRQSSTRPPFNPLSLVFSATFDLQNACNAERILYASNFIRFIGLRRKLCVLPLHGP